MAWQNILGHDEVVQRFRQAISRGRLASTFLFVGPPGIGKRTFALKLAQGLLCDVHETRELDPCGKCPQCVQLSAGSHPDVELVSRPPDKAFLPLELFIGEGENRLREGMCYNLSLKPYSGKRRIAIIDDADYFNREGANSLLKTLEEPPPNALIILIGTSEQRQLPTIRSRCQTVRFRPLSESDVAELLVRQGYAENAVLAQSAASKSQGSLDRAREQFDVDLAEFRATLVEHLAQRELDSSALAKTTGAFVDGAGKEGAAKRARLKQVIAAASDFYRQLMIALAEPGDAQLPKSVQTVLRWWPGGEEAAAHCIDLCLDAHSAVESNANQATLLECWFDELGTTARTGRPV